MPINPIERFEALVAANGGQLPKTVRLTRYESLADWQMPAEDGPTTESDFKTAIKKTDDFAEYLTRKGVMVEAVKFDREAYKQWRGNRVDSRNLRAQWATEKDRKLTFAFKIGHDGIGWAVLSPLFWKGKEK